MSIKELIENEQLDEFKASFGDPSEVPEPTSKKAPARKGDKKVEDNPKDAETAVKAPGTKAGIINAMMNKMNKMEAKELKAIYGDLLTSLEAPEGIEVQEEELVSIRTLPQVTREDIDVSEDVVAMFAGDDLSEDFKDKATTIFESAVVAKVNEQLEKISANFESELAEEIDAVRVEMVEKLDSYTDYVVEQWMDENRLAVEQGIKAEMVENFMKGLKGLFEEHYIDLPDEKVDVVEELAGKVEDLEARLNEEIQRNVEMKSVVQEHAKKDLIDTVSEGLTETQRAKFATLAEGVDFKNEENFVKKLNTIKESYFGNLVEDTSASYEFDEQEPLEEEVKPAKVSGPMQDYVNAISRSIKK